MVKESISRIKLTGIILLVSVFLLLSGLPVFAEDEYTIIDLGSLGGGLSYPFSINDIGQVVGLSGLATGERHAFLWENGTMEDLRTLGGFTLTSIAYGINNSGQIAGWSTIDENPYTRHAFLWEGGEMNDLGTLGGEHSHAYAINDAGQVVGEAQRTDGNSYAFLWKDGAMTNLGALGGNQSAARDINNSGQVVGGAYTSGGNIRAFLWEDGTMNDLGTVDGQQSGAYGINESGQVVGNFHLAEVGQPPQPPHAFLWEDGVMNDLGTLEGLLSYARGVNNLGQVVGEAQGGDGRDYAFIWEYGIMKDLNTLIPADAERFLYNANAINDAGWIVGEGYVNGQTNVTHAFLLKPNVVPEPVSCALFLLGGALFAGRRFRKKIS